MGAGGSAWTLAFSGAIPAPDTGSTRSSGIHVSQCVQAICIARGVLRDDYTPNPALLHFGLAVERAVIAMYDECEPGRYTRPGELARDGLLGTPDLYDARDDSLDEIKSTYLSSRVDPAGPKFFKYDLQVAAYCHMLGTPRSRLHVVHLRGDYSQGDGPPAPVLHVWERVWTRSELIETWALIKQYARKVQPEQH